MIVDTTAKLRSYTHLHPLFANITEYCNTTDLNTLALGKHLIPNSDHFFSILEKEQPDQNPPQLERHTLFIDVHITLGGLDKIGWKSQDSCTSSQGYSSETDTELYEHQEITQWIVLPKDFFAIFFPWDAHAPWAGSEAVQKAVFKVPVISTRTS